MFQILNISGKCILGCGLALALFVPLASAHANTFDVLYSFCGQSNCSDGGYPSGLINDKAGNVYGTTQIGGGTSGCYYGSCGTVFKVTPHGKESVLYAFQGGNDAEQGGNALIADKALNLYGTTFFGGGASGCVAGSCGTVFKLAPNGNSWTESVLYAFKGGNDGDGPEAALVEDKKGNLYGTTLYGGSTCNLLNQGPYGCGTVFKIAPDGTETVLFAFTSYSEGLAPYGSLILDKKGNLYGTTFDGGGNTGCKYGFQCGTVYELSPPIGGNGPWTENVLYAFCAQANCADGANPLEERLVADATGNLYGVTTNGGGTACNGGGGCGVVFKLAPNGNSWTETVVYAFQGGNDGNGPYAGLILDKNGNLYGSAYGDGQYGGGTIFEITSGGVFNVLHAFNPPTDGNAPSNGVIMYKNHLYGTTIFGANGYGTAFKLTK